VQRDVEDRGRRRGVSAAEAALALPLFIVLVAGLVDGGRYFMLRQLLDNAVREGARLAIVSAGSFTSEQIASEVAGRLDAGTFPHLQVEVYLADAATGDKIGEWSDALWGDCIAVRATADYVSLLPTFSGMPGNGTIRATCTMYCEGN
jgi:hypothetical protein